MKKKKLWLVTGVAAAAVLAAGTVTFAYQSGSDSEEQTVYKEVTVEKGNLTAGVTESGSVTYCYLFVGRPNTHNPYE